MGDPQQGDEAMRRLASAAVWRVRLTEAGLESSAAFETWLAEDPANEIAWRQVNASWDLLGEQAANPDVVAARRQALARAGEHATTTPAQKHPRAYALAGLAAGLVAIVAGAFWWFAQSSEYRTGLGERRVVTLDDGSKLSLDSQTVVQVRYSADARRLKLAKGQARFDVFHNAGRPFSVDAGDRTVIATGTSFNIDLRQSTVVVTLIEGRVLVTQHAAAELSSASQEVAAASAVPLDAGQTLTTSLGGPAPPRIENVDVATVTSWESGRLMFDDEPLDEVVERVSRYSSQPILIADERAAKLRISGVFNAGDVPTFVDTLSRYLPVRATSQPDGSIVLASAPRTP